MGILDSLVNSVANSVKREAKNAANNAMSSAKRTAQTTINKAADKGIKTVASNLQRKEMKVVFKTLPKNLEELKALPEASLKEPHYAVALAMAALLLYNEDRDACVEMLDYLNGPSNVGEYSKQFMDDRLEEKDYVVKSFFEGSKPENNYTPTEPYTIKVIQTAVTDEVVSEGYKRLFVQSSGADALREVRVRTKPSTGQWFLWEIYALSDIRIPKSADPWS